MPNPVQITGSVCALITPFTSDEQIDFAALAVLIEAQIQGGTDALVIAGSTGESVALEEHEFVRLLTEAKRLADGRIRLLAGTGAPSTAKALTLTRLAQSYGADAALVVTPAYVRPGAEGLYQHYARIADEGGLPIMLYNVPSRTACDLLPETVARLSGHPQVIGIKEAVVDMARLQQLIELQTADFSVLSGDDSSALQAFRLGARGLVSVAANPLPAAMHRLWAHAHAGQWAQAEQLQRRLMPLFHALALESNPIPVKWAMHTLSLCSSTLRSPLTVLAAHHRAIVADALAEFTSRALAA